MLTAIGSVVVWGIVIALAVFGEVPNVKRPWQAPMNVVTDGPLFVKLAIVATLFLLPACVLRVRRIRRLFDFGVVVEGKVTLVRLVKDRGRIEYDFPFGGIPRHGGMAVHRNTRVNALRVGDRVAVLVDQDDPRRTILRDIFFGED